MNEALPDRWREKLLMVKTTHHADTHDDNFDTSCGTCVAQLWLETHAVELAVALDAAEAQRDEALRRLKTIAGASHESKSTAQA